MLCKTFQDLQNNNCWNLNVILGIPSCRQVRGQQASQGCTCVKTGVFCSSENVKKRRSSKHLARVQTPERERERETHWLIMLERERVNPGVSLPADGSAFPGLVRGGVGGVETTVLSAVKGTCCCYFTRFRPDTRLHYEASLTPPPLLSKT